MVFACAVRAKQSEDFTFLDRKIEAVDRKRRAIALTERLRIYDRLNHRRPNLRTEPTSTSSAAAMTPAPANPHRVEVRTVTR